MARWRVDILRSRAAPSYGGYSSYGYPAYGGVGVGIGIGPSYGYGPGYGYGGLGYGGYGYGGA